MTVLVIGHDPLDITPALQDTGCVSFTVLGRAQPVGSKKQVTNPKTGKSYVIDDAKGSRPWKQEVAATALQYRPSELLAGPVELQLVFFVARPKSHYGTGRNAAVVKPSAPVFPITRPDCTKLVRCVEDALTNVIWRDDAQVVHQVAGKRYGTPERCEITITPLHETPVVNERAA